ncbi:hypothetical protein L7F22_047772 [Adiantum nelumboides]|nr:hypothetical protein [Adiantum nelumboides]
MQGLDPLATANTFGNAQCVGEKKMGDEECFVLKLSADPSTLSERNNGPSEVIRHALLGYFSQRTVESTLRDYKAVDGVTMSHAGHSVVTLLRFGNADAASHTWTRIEETWSIEEVAFNVQGLSQEFFLPPADVCSAK